MKCHRRSGVAGPPLPKPGLVQDSRIPKNGNHNPGKIPGNPGV